MKYSILKFKLINLRKDHREASICSEP